MGIIAKQSIQGTIVTYLGVAVGFVTTFFVLTRFLSAEEIGLARVLVDAATLFIGLAQLGTSSSIIRFYPHFKHRVASCRMVQNSAEKTTPHHSTQLPHNATQLYPPLRPRFFLLDADYSARRFCPIHRYLLCLP